MVEQKVPNWTGKCPRCGGPLPRNVGGGRGGAIMAASPPEEVCERCLTGHEPNWIELPEPDWRFGRWLHRSWLFKWMNSTR